MAPATRQSRKMVAENNSRNATPTRRWHRLILDDDSEEDIEESKPCMENSEKRELSQKPGYDTACALDNEPVHACVEESGLVTTRFPHLHEPPRPSSNPMQMLNLLSDTSSLPPKPVPIAVSSRTSSTAPPAPVPPKRASKTTEPANNKEISSSNHQGESIPCRIHRSEAQSQADNVEEAEDSGVDVPDKNVPPSPQVRKTFDYTLPQRSQSCERSIEASKSTCSHSEEENEDSASSSDHTDQDLVRSRQRSVSSPLSTPPGSPTKTNVEPALTNEAENDTMPSAPAAESRVLKQAMSRESRVKNFAQESRTGRDRLRTKHQDHDEEALPHKRGQSTTPLDGVFVADKVLKCTSVSSRENDTMKSTRGANSVVADHTNITETAQLSEELEMSTPETQSALEEPKTLLEDIVEAVLRSNRKAFTTGDVAIILDTGDLTKTLLIPSTPLLEQTTFLNRDLCRDLSPESLLKHAFVLAVNENVCNMPRLVCITNGLLEKADLTNSGCETYQHALDIATAVKEEPNQELYEDVVAQALPRLNWMKAFEAFLCIVTNTKVPHRREIQNILRMLGSNAKAALPQIEGVLDFAKHFEAVDAVATTLTLAIHAYTGNQTLWPAVADEAASWLVVAQEIEDEAVFKEAFCHVAGRWPIWPWCKTIGSISDDLKNDIEVARNEIEIKHQATQVKLLRLTLTTDKNTGIPVSQRSAPYKYDVVCFWSQWIASHFEYLEAKRESNSLGDPPNSDFCDHPDDTCLNIAKLYRAIGKDGDAYLPFDSMMKKWDKKTYGSDESEQRDALAELKRAASVIVAPMAESSLQYGLKHEIDYLTCIKVEAKDVPWKMHEEDQAEEMEI